MAYKVTVYTGIYIYFRRCQQSIDEEKTPATQQSAQFSLCYPTLKPAEPFCTHHIYLIYIHKGSIHLSCNYYCDYYDYYIAVIT